MDRSDLLYQITNILELFRLIELKASPKLQTQYSNMGEEMEPRWTGQDAARQLICGDRKATLHILDSFETA